MQQSIRANEQVVGRLMVARAALNRAACEVMELDKPDWPTLREAIATTQMAADKTQTAFEVRRFGYGQTGTLGVLLEGREVNHG